MTTTPAPASSAAQAIPAGLGWETLASRLRPFVARRLGGDADVDDAMQEILLRVYRGLPKLEDRERHGAWVFQIARNAIADQLRLRQRFPLCDQPTTPETAAEPEVDLDAELPALLAQSLGFFVAALPSPYREAITLVELEGLTHKRAAAMLGISVSGVKSRVQRGRAKLRALLEACCEIALDPRGAVRRCEPRERIEVPEDCCR